MQYTFQVISALALLTILGQAIALVFLANLLWQAMRRDRSTFLTRLLSRRGLLFMFVVALVATCGSLFFSEIAGLLPCKFCWFQRIFMYPQTLLLLIALWRKDRGIAVSILALSLIGMAFSVTHYSEQVQAVLHPVAIGNSLVACDPSGISCAATQISFLFGYISIPLMAFTAFLLNALTSLSLLRRNKENWA